MASMLKARVMRFPAARMVHETHLGAVAEMAETPTA